MNYFNGVPIIASEYITRKQVLAKKGKTKRQIKKYTNKYGYKVVHVAIFADNPIYGKVIYMHPETIAKLKEVL